MERLQREDCVDGELAFTAKMLDMDSKNYHVWSYRQWLVTHFALWEQERAFVDAMIGKDLRNNSAWNQCYFVACNSGKEGASLLETQEGRMAEAATAKQAEDIPQIL